MNTNVNNARYKLLATFNDLQKEFDQSLTQAKQQEQDLNQYCQDFHEKVKKHLVKAKSTFSTDNPLAKPLENFINLIEDINVDWNKRFTQQDKGVRFRQGHNDSLLVFVFGKVKSGKSSLGNYIAWGHTDPTPEFKQATVEYLQPKYHSHERTTVKSGDQHKEAEKTQEFRVGATEATSSIQSFSLPGLTWVDSPGLHSINEENGQLAKEFVEHADLILYTMKSDSPGRESDVKEIAQLHSNKKRIIILITGSDEVDEDVDDNGEIISTTVMKTVKTRQAQQESVRQALDNVPELQEIRDNVEIISFSARYAQEHEHDQQAFLDSGMEQFFDVLQQTAKTNGIKIKQQTPLQNFKNYLNKFDDDLKKYKNFLESFDKPLADLSRKIPLKVSKESVNIKNNLSTMIDKKFVELENFRDDELQIQTELKNFQADLQKVSQKLLSQAKTTIIKEIMNDFGSKIIAIVENSDLLELPEFKLEKKKQKYVKGIKVGTKNRNSGIGGLFGGVAGGVTGFLLGGPAGAAIGIGIGSTLGSVTGSALGDDASEIHDEFTVIVGDNLSDIKLKYHDLFAQFIDKEMTIFQTALMDISFAQATAFKEDVEAEINILQRQFNQKRLEIDHKLQSGELA